MNPAFINSVKNKNTELKQKLLKGGIIEKENFLHQFIEADQLKKSRKIHNFKQIMKCDPNINQENSEGETPLYLAAYHGNMKIVKLLIDHGAVIDAIANNKTSIEVAYEQKHEKVGNYLHNQYFGETVSEGEKKIWILGDKPGSTEQKSINKLGHLPPVVVMVIMIHHLNGGYAHGLRVFRQIHSCTDSVHLAHEFVRGSNDLSPVLLSA